MRSCRGGRAEDKVQTTISTNVMISANICRLPPTTRRLPPAKHCSPYATSLTPPGAWRMQLSKSLDRSCRSIHGSMQSSEIGSVLPLESVLESVEPRRLGVYHRVQLGVYFRECSGVCLRASWELTWVRTVKQAGSVPSSAIGSVLESMPRGVLENVLGGVLGSVLGGVLGSVLGVYSECT